MFIRSPRVLACGADNSWTSSLLGFGRRAHVDSVNGVQSRVLATNENAIANFTAFSPELYRVFPTYDLIHIHQPFTISGQTAAVVAAQSKVPFVLTDLGAGNRKTLFAIDVLRRASAIVAISEYSKRQLAEFFPGSHIAVVIGPVESRWFSDVGASARAGVLYVGRILPHKGVDRIIGAAPRDLPITIAGASADERYLRHLIAMAEGKTVSFRLNPADLELTELYRTHEFYCIASTHRDCFGSFYENPELMGITTMEALASGCKVIVSDTTSLPEIVRNAPDGVARVFSSDAELKSILREIAIAKPGSSDEAPRLATAYAARFGKDEVGRRLGVLYRQIIDNKRLGE